MLHHRLAAIARWTARILGAAALILWLTFFVGSGGLQALSYPTPAVLFGLLVFALIGYIIAWRKERSGSALLLLAGFGLVAHVYLFAGRPSDGRTTVAAAIGGPFLLAGILFWLAARWSRAEPTARGGP